MKAPHEWQMERLAKLWPPQAQRQSPGRMFEPLRPLRDSPRPPPKLPWSGKSLLDLNSPQFWHELRRLKLKCWHDLQFQSPGHLLIFSSPIALNELLMICA